MHRRFTKGGEPKAPVVTTIRIDYPLWLQLRIACLEEQRAAKDIITAAVTDYLTKAGYPVAEATQS